MNAWTLGREYGSSQGAVPYEERRGEDHETIERWARPEGADLENEAQRAKVKLRTVDRTRE